MPFSSLIGNDRIKDSLKRSVAEGRIAQALMFAGPVGVGKYQFALALAQALNCPQLSAGDACGECVSCRKIAAAEHPDVETFVPDGQYIKIGEMRRLSEAAQYRPFEGKRRVYIIDEAEKLNVNAANSILKTLEEPPDCTVLVLVSAKPDKLPETIRSRCQRLNFARLTESALSAHLSKGGKLQPQDAAVLARLAVGSIGRASEVDLDDYKEVRRIMLELLDAFAVSRDTVRLIGAAEYLGKKLEREAFEKHLDVLLVLLQDVVHFKHGVPAESLINADVSPRIERVAAAIEFERIAGLIEGIEELLKALPRNINRHIAMEAVLISA
jgi:DNA polymerase-3 subunit delta'